jgi:type IX secretion system PorP/SprF family membrane protein
MTKTSIKKLICMRIKSILAVLFFTVVCLSNTQAQQQFEISQYMQHNFIYNPAAAGASDAPSVGAIYRKMWSGIDGGPQTTILYGDKYFDKKNTGVAVFLYNDQTGPTSQTGGQVDLSYSVDLGSKDKRLMFGLGGVFFQYQIDKAYLLNDPTAAGDNTLQGASDSKITADAAAGIYLKTPTINIGASVEQIIKSQLDLLKENATVNTDLEAKLYRHYYVMADYNWKVDEDNTLVPNVLLKYLYNSPVDLQMGVKLEHQDFLWVGFGYHYQQSYSFFAGVKIKHQFEIGYDYDQFVTPLSVFNNGGASNEFGLRYYFVK